VDHVLRLEERFAGGHRGLFTVVAVEFAKWPYFGSGADVTIQR
jgi:hypothetical protein